MLVAEDPGELEFFEGFLQEFSGMHIHEILSRFDPTSEMVRLFCELRSIFSYRPGLLLSVDEAGDVATDSQAS